MRKFFSLFLFFVLLLRLQAQQETFVAILTIGSEQPSWLEELLRGNKSAELNGLMTSAQNANYKVNRITEGYVVFPSQLVDEVERIANLLEALKKSNDLSLIAEDIPTIDTIVDVSPSSITDEVRIEDRVALVLQVQVIYSIHGQQQIATLGLLKNSGTEYYGHPKIANESRENIQSEDVRSLYAFAPPISGLSFHVFSISDNRLVPVRNIDDKYLAVCQNAVSYLLQEKRRLQRECLLLVEELVSTLKQRAASVHDGVVSLTDLPSDFRRNFEGYLRATHNIDLESLGSLQIGITYEPILEVPIAIDIGGHKVNIDIHAPLKDLIRGKKIRVKIASR